MMMPLALVGFLGLSLIPVGILGSWILHPVNEARRRIHAPTRFMLTDFFWLMALIQAALAFTTQFVPQDEPEAFWIVLAFLLFAITAIWAGGVSFLSEAGVRLIIRRAAFQLLLLPGTMLVMIGLPFLGLLTLVFMLRREINWADPTNGFVIGWTCVAVGCVVLRLLSQWLAGWKSAARVPKELSAT